MLYRRTTTPRGNTRHRLAAVFICVLAGLGLAATTHPAQAAPPAVAVVR